MQGFLNINKPANVTSAFVVNKIKKQFNIKKIGHLGTLDPLATGVLPIAIGKAAKLFDYFLNKEKEYIVEVEFGYETDTLDTEGQKLSETKIIPTYEEITEIVKTFIGKQNQMPPKYSAKNVNGKRAYELARSGVDFELSPKEIEIFEIKLLKKISNEKFEFLIKCSGGTYIRSIARDLAYKLNSLATMTNLIRTKSGEFDIKNSITLEELLNLRNLENNIITIEEILPYQIYKLNNNEFEKLKNGLAVKIENVTNETYVLKFEQQLLGIGEVEEGNLKIQTYLLEEN